MTEERKDTQVNFRERAIKQMDDAIGDLYDIKECEGMTEQDGCVCERCTTIQSVLTGISSLKAKLLHTEAALGRKVMARLDIGGQRGGDIELLDIPIPRSSPGRIVMNVGGDIEFPYSPECWRCDAGDPRRIGGSHYYGPCPSGPKLIDTTPEEELVAEDLERLGESGDASGLYELAASVKKTLEGE